ncbi:MAG: S-adenosylmethionine:tRNA ribosyltransferase-isomerase [Sphingobacteriales bacterium]|nr:S-adenosylmethionine:tRNA ribosyltransferase-isomerase [Sphingobacteriales bacterium]
MNHPKDISIKDFTYHLPDEQIAKYPLPQRDESKLLLYKNGVISEDVYKNIAKHIPADSLLVFNNTKVVEARLLFQKPTGGTIEIFCLEPFDDVDIAQALMQQGKARWKCLVGGASKWKNGLLEKRINNGDEIIQLFAEKIEQLNDSYVVELTWHSPDLSFVEVLHAAGLLPIPPYLNRQAEQSDYERYQTIYAKNEGSVAAPTAGLHFTSNVIQLLNEKEILQEYVTLHVGAGTFKPVKSDKMEDHEMHSEWIDVSCVTIENILKHLSREIIPVGTTSLRTIETLYWMGVKIYFDPLISLDALEIKQWDAYELAEKTIDAKQALQALLSWMSTRDMNRIIIPTQLLIAPGYKAMIADAIITNFHQPGSTLLLLVAALTGDDWRKIYSYALENNFRFLSYGDGSLLWVNK